MTQDERSILARDLLVRARAHLDHASPPADAPSDPTLAMERDAEAMFTALHALRVHGGHAPLPCTLGCRHALVEELATAHWARPIRGGMISAARAVAEAFDLTGVLSPALPWRAPAEAITRAVAEAILATVSGHVAKTPAALPVPEPLWEIATLMRWADALWAHPPWEDTAPAPRGNAWRCALADAGRAVLHRLHALHLLVGGTPLPSTEGAREWLSSTRLRELIDAGLVDRAWWDGIHDAAHLLDDTASDTCWATEDDAQGLWEGARCTDSLLRDAILARCRRHAERGGVSPPMDDVFGAVGMSPLEATQARLAVDIGTQRQRLRATRPEAEPSGAHVPPLPGAIDRPAAERFLQALACAVRDGLCVDVRLSEEAGMGTAGRDPSAPDNAPRPGESPR